MHIEQDRALAVYTNYGSFDEIDAKKGTNGAIGSANLVICINKERKGKSMQGAKTLVTGRIGLIHAIDGNACLLKLCPVISNRAQLHRAARRHVPGIKD